MSSHFIWYELLTTNADEAQHFYSDVLGWTINPRTTPEMDYRHIVASDGAGIGGMLQLTQDMQDGGARPAWLGYLSVADVDGAIRSIEVHSGSTMMKPFTVEGAGRVAMVTDPQGAPFYVMAPAPPADRPQATSTAFSRTAVGHCAWNELATSDPAAALAFYTGEFGLSDGGSMPMGNGGSYQFLNAGDEMIGAITRPAADNQPPMWIYYFRVPSLDAAMKKIEAGGGTVVNGPHEVPGGDHIIIGSDPQGATFALVRAR